MNFLYCLAAAAVILKCVHHSAWGASLTPKAPLLLRPVDPEEQDSLLKFVLTEIQRLKQENKEMDSCHGLELASMETQDERVENGLKHRLTLKIQPTLVNTPACAHRNTTTNQQPEVCEAEVWESNEEDRHQMALLRSTCLQVDELRT
ncbi:uncharacterized protein LOC135398111 [Ornithodoros turicata]|uniref:uncharacterized protein LOC135398111 n=1 Tax=Ornithodoros turicata TaxID=34597 RepID=UPI003139F2BA